MNVVEKPVIVRNSNVSLVEGRGQERIYRVLGYNDSHVHLVELGVAKASKVGLRETRSFTLNSPPKRMRNRLVWPRRDVDRRLADGTLVRVAEHGIPVQMAQQIVPPGACAQLDVRRNVVSHIERCGGDVVLEDRAVYAQQIRDAADRFNVTTNSVRKWFETHLFYGGHENALMDHHRVGDYNQRLV